MHVGEARPELGHVGTDQRIGHQVDVVGDDHQVAHAERRVDAARSVRHKEVFDADLLHHAHREGHLLHRVALVVVEAALHGDDPAAFDLSEDHAALVALDRRNGESGNVLVFDDEPGVDLIGEIAQSGSEYDPHFGREILGPGSDESGGFLNFL